MEHFSHVIFGCVWLSRLRKQLSSDLGDISDTKMTSATSTFLFLGLVQMFRLVAVGGERLSGWHSGWHSS